MKRYGEGEQSGIKDHHLLESAIFRPQQTVFGEDAYKSLFDKGAALFESLVKNHSFYNGNKRTAFVCTDIFLKKNGYKIKKQDKINEDFTVSIADGSSTFEDIVKWLQNNTEEK
ncbi:type II toxin-antitoxin system death-on-curing family toxin [Tenuibacillus multivorans]